jgi:putative transcription antitermination factor YqgF
VRVLALDYGSARCGVAVSDPTGALATPLEPVLEPTGRKGMGKLLALVREVEAERVIVGLPLSLSGGDSAQTREARAFAAVLAKRLDGVPVELYDERFTTRLAQRDGGEPGRGSRTARASEDSRAAAHLLSSWLDRHADA